MIRAIIYLLGLCALAVLVMTGALILCFSQVQWGEYAQKGQDLAKEKIARAVRSALEEPGKGAGAAARPEAPPPVPEAQGRPAQGRPGQIEPAAEDVVSRKRNHWVQKGETLFSISLRYYDDGRRWKELARANKIDDPCKLRAGMRLEIP